MKASLFNNATGLQKLLSRAVTARVESRYRGVDLTLRTLVPFHHKTVHVSIEDLIEVWPGASSALHQLSTLTDLQDKPGMARLLKQTFENSSNEPERQYWLLSDAFYWHSELQGIVYESTANFIAILTKDGKEHTILNHVIEQMHPWLLNIARHIELMGLTSEQTLEALNYYAFKSGNYPSIHEAKLPERIQDIVGIENTHTGSTHVTYLLRERNVASLTWASSSLEALERKFPKITQALLSLYGRHYPDYERACHIRHWFSIYDLSPSDTLVFDTHSARQDIAQNFKYGLSKPYLTWPYFLNELVGLDQSEEYETGLLFKIVPGEAARRVKIFHKSPQAVHLGLDKLLELVRDMGLEGDIAADAIRSAFCTQGDSKAVQIPDLDMDDFQLF